VEQIVYHFDVSPITEIPSHRIILSKNIEAHPSLSKVAYVY